MWGVEEGGKSMLMDLFVETLGIAEKRRAHFHEFMLEVDRRMRERRTSDPGDPTGKVARDIAADVRCRAFDEMVVNNTADAAIMARPVTWLLYSTDVAEGATWCRHGGGRDMSRGT